MCGEARAMTGLPYLRCELLHVDGSRARDSRHGDTGVRSRRPRRPRLPSARVYPLSRQESSQRRLHLEANTHSLSPIHCPCPCILVCNCTTSTFILSPSACVSPICFSNRLISRSMKSRRPSTAMTASLRSCFRRTGPTSL